MPEKSKVTRRSLVGRLAGLVGAGSLRLNAAGGGPNRALVCLFLSGGNDSANMFVPLAAEEYAAYARVRGSLAIRKSELLPVQNAANGMPYGFHPALTCFADQFVLNRLAVVANTGLAGTQPPTHTPSSIGFLPNGFVAPAWALSTATPAHAYTFSSGLNVLLPDWQANTNKVMDQATLRGFIPKSSVVPFPNTPLGKQLMQAAYLIKASITTGLGRQIYTATLAGFDTHTEQNQIQNQLFTDLNAATTAFLMALEVLGISNNVVVYTDSEFGRSLRPNNSAGTDNGWGAHQLVLGNAVLGGSVYGPFPPMSLGVTPDVTGTGVWAPETAREQMTIPLARWLGLTSPQIVFAFPEETGLALPLVI